MSIPDVLDLVVKVTATLLGSAAMLQLFEARRRRLVEMYWKISEDYLSSETHNRRRSVSKIEEWLDGRLKIKDPASLENFAQLYKVEYHDASFGSPNKELDVEVRKHIRFLNQVGVLTRKRLVDRDLTFGLIGAGLEIDYPALKVVVEAHRLAHRMDEMYIDFDALWKIYRGWKKRRN